MDLWKARLFTKVDKQDNVAMSRKIGTYSFTFLLLFHFVLAVSTHFNEMFVQEDISAVSLSADDE